jgi:hypothetical protein
MASAIGTLHSHGFLHARQLDENPGLWRDNITVRDLIVEAWSQGFMVAGLLVMAFITIANMRAGIFLHKLILLEVGGLHLLPVFAPMSFD